MNERLTYLWEQANIRYSVYETAKPREERKTVPDIFSQMIIRECADVASINQHQYNDVGNYVKQHFGIE